MKIDFKYFELAVLIKAYYEIDKDIDPEFISEELYYDLAEELCNIVDDWDKVGIPFFEWCRDVLTIYPLDFVPKEDLESWKSNQLFIDWNGIMVSGWLGEKI